MSRMHPGKPPSQRRTPLADWKNKVYEFTIVLAHKLKTLLELDDPAARDHVIRAVRLAINESGDPQIDAALAGVTHRSWTLSDEARDDEGVMMTSAAFRLMLDKNSLNRKDPSLAESIMQVVVETLDGECGFGWRSKVLSVTRIMADTLLRIRSGDKASIRQDLVDAAREALDGHQGDGEKVLDVPDRETGTPAPELCLSKSGMYRMILDSEVFARDKEMTDEAFMAEVMKAADEALA
jgi:hypothetical protein